MTTTSLSTAERLRLLRQRVGLTQTQLAELVGCDPDSIWRFEAGMTPRRSPLLDRVIATLEQLERA